MDALDAISRRRSISRFKEDRIPRELLEKLLAVSVLSPSAKNRQPWRFVVLEGQARLTLSRLMAQGAEFLKSRGVTVWRETE